MRVIKTHTTQKSYVTMYGVFVSLNIYHLHGVL